MVPCLEMLGKKAGHRVHVLGEEDSTFAFGPEEDRGIGAAQRQVRRVADAKRIDLQLARGVVPLNRQPQDAAQMLVEKEPQHGSFPLGLLDRLQPLP